MAPAVNYTNHSHSELRLGMEWSVIAYLFSSLEPGTKGIDPNSLAVGLVSAIHKDSSRLEAGLDKEGERGANPNINSS